MDIIPLSHTSRPRYVTEIEDEPILTCMTFLQVLFDILPLRLVPPLMFGGIVYGLVGLVPTVPGFWKFMLTLVLFNLTTASVVLWLSIAFSSISVASLVGTLVMLFKCVYLFLIIYILIFTDISIDACYFFNQVFCSRDCWSIGKLSCRLFNGSIPSHSSMLRLKLWP